MTSIRIIVIASIVQISALLAAFAAAGGGHGVYSPAKCLFPYTMMSTIRSNRIEGPFLLLACVQFLIYGGVLACFNAQHKLRETAIVLLIVHGLAVGAAFVLSASAFRP